MNKTTYGKQPEECSTVKELNDQIQFSILHSTLLRLSRHASRIKLLVLHVPFHGNVIMLLLRGGVLATAACSGHLGGLWMVCGCVWFVDSTLELSSNPVHPHVFHKPWFVSPASSDNQMRLSRGLPAKRREWLVVLAEFQSDSIIGRSYPLL